MKNFTLVWVAALAITLNSCFADNDDVPEIISEWKLVGVVESHDVTADFAPTHRNEIIAFLPHSRVSRNPYWCGQEMTVNYSEEGYIFNYCSDDESDALMFTIEDEIMVITDPACTEGCRTKYERIR